MSARRVVLTADDYGYEPASSELVVRLLREGRLTATTVLAIAPGLERQVPALLAPDVVSGRCGLHLAITSERGREPWRPLSEAGRRTLAGSDPDGALPVDLAQVEARTTDAVIAEEIEAQRRRVAALGLTPVRLDMHAGALYGLHGTSTLGAALTACARHGWGCRLPRSLRLYLGDDVPEAVRALHAQVVAAADGLGVPLPQTMATDPRPIAAIDGYEDLRRHYVALLAQLPEGTSEVFLHPGADTAWSREHEGQSWDKRLWEARLLEDPVWLDALEREDVKLVDTW